MLGRILLVVAALGLTAFVYNEWETRKFMNPDRQSVVDEIEWFTGYTVPNEAKILFAKRSRPSPLLGDYSSCVLITLNEENFLDFTTQFEPIAPHGFEFSCPDFSEFMQMTDQFNFQHLTYKTIEPDEWFLVQADPQRSAALFAMSMM